MTAHPITETVAVRLACNGRGCLAVVTAEKVAATDDVAALTYRAETVAEMRGWTGWKNDSIDRPYRRDYCQAHTPKKSPANLRQTY